MEEELKMWPLIQVCGASDIGEECTRLQGHAGDHEGEHYSWPRETERCWQPHSGDFCQRPKGHEDEHSWRPDEDIDPNELATFGEVLDYWTMRGGMTDNERTAYWQSWSRHMTVWTFVVVGGVIFMESVDGLAGDAGMFAAIFAVLALIWQAVDAVRFALRARRWQR